MDEVGLLAQVGGKMSRGRIVRVDVLASENRLVIRRIRDEPAEYERIAAWQNQPHVREW